MSKSQGRHVCGVCGEPRSPFVLNNKTVCLKCDELLFDLEIECDEADRYSTKEKAISHPPVLKTVIQVVKK